MPNPKGRPIKHVTPTIPKSFRLDSHTVCTIESESQAQGISQADVLRNWADNHFLQRDSVIEARKLLADALAENDKGRVSSAVVREVLELLNLVR